jgi:hypothetical protein
MKIFALVLVVLLSGCINARPFQPNPPMYQLYVKDGATESDVKASMLKCGYPNVVGNSGDETLNEKAERQNCIARNGFKRSDGLPGICPLRADLPACQSAQ